MVGGDPAVSVEAQVVDRHRDAGGGEDAEDNEKEHGRNAMSARVLPRVAGLTLYV